MSETEPMLGMKLVCGFTAFITASHSTTSRVSTERRHACQRDPGGVLDAVRPRQVEARGVVEVVRAGVAVADAVALPAVGEDRVDVVVAGDLLEHLRHELEVVVGVGAGHPDFGEGPVAPLVAVLVDGDPLGMRVGRVLVDGVGIDARHHVHAELARARDQRPEGIAVADVLAHVVERHLARVVGDVAAGAEAGRVRLRALEDVDPLLGIELDRVVLGKGQLGPARRRLVPVGRAKLAVLRGLVAGIVGSITRKIVAPSPALGGGTGARAGSFVRISS